MKNLKSKEITLTFLIYLFLFTFTDSGCRCGSNKDDKTQKEHFELLVKLEET